MPVCESVSIIANEIEEQLKNVSVAEKVRLNALKKMPIFLERMRLDLFDTEYTNGYEEGENEETTSFKSIEILAELAFENMVSLN